MSAPCTPAAFPAMPSTTTTQPARPLVIRWTVTTASGHALGDDLTLPEAMDVSTRWRTFEPGVRFIYSSRRTA